MCIHYNVPDPEEIENELNIGFMEVAEDEDNAALRRVNPELADGKQARNKFVVLLSNRRQNPV